MDVVFPAGEAAQGEVWLPRTGGDGRWAWYSGSALRLSFVFSSSSSFVSLSSVGMGKEPDTQVPLLDYHSDDLDVHHFDVDIIFQMSFYGKQGLTVKTRMCIDWNTFFIQVSGTQLWSMQLIWCSQTWESAWSTSLDVLVCPYPQWISQPFHHFGNFIRWTLM